MSCEELCTGEARYIYVSLRGQVRAHAYVYTREPNHNNARGQCRDRLSLKMCANEFNTLYKYIMARYKGI
jgi:hypothetical protein